MKKYILLTLAVVFSLSLISGCGSVPIGSEKVVDWKDGYNKKAPSWTELTYKEQKGYLYFAGIKSGVQNKDLGIRQAKAEAIKNVAEGISMKVTTEFTDSIQGSNINENDLGDYTRDAIGIVSKLPALQGLQIEENYWQKIERKVGANEVKYFFNCYALVKLSVADYKKARDAVLGDIVNKAKKKKDAVARDIAEKMMERMTEE